MKKATTVNSINSIGASVGSVQVGQIAPLGRKGVPSGFIKRPVTGAVMIEKLGLVGDQQADHRVHGGADKAVYCYPIEHYARWREMLEGKEYLLVAGGFGENLTTQGLDEGRVCVGDIFQVGRARVQVTQPRQPCFKLALRFEDSQMIKAMVRYGLSGWYLRVLEPGLVEAGASIAMLDRPNPAWSISRLNRLLGRRGTREEIAELAALRGLAGDLRGSARAALEEE
jgi:MOSC domain-containing protein YiiM